MKNNEMFTIPIDITLKELKEYRDRVQKALDSGYFCDDNVSRLTVNMLTAGISAMEEVNNAERHTLLKFKSSGVLCINCKSKIVLDNLSSLINSLTEVLFSVEPDISIKACISHTMLYMVFGSKKIGVSSRVIENKGLTDALIQVSNNWEHKDVNCIVYSYDKATYSSFDIVSRLVEDSLNKSFVPAYSFNAKSVLSLYREIENSEFNLNNYLNHLKVVTGHPHDTYCNQECDFAQSKTMTDELKLNCLNNKDIKQIIDILVTMQRGVL